MDAQVGLLVDSLIGDLERDMKYEKHLATGDYWLALIIMLATLGPSFVAGIGGIALGWGGVKTGAVAFIPGALAIIATTLKLEPKANWHYRKLYGLSSLHQRLKYEMPGDLTREHVAAISKEKRELVQQMEKEWETSLALSWSHVKQHPQ